ncbi:MAG: cysteine desulfurase NifS [Chloroflexota bacterium]
MINFDHAATTPTRPEVLQAMLSFFTELYSNPSSVHSSASIPQEALDRARAGVASVLGSSPGEIVFTSGGTESDNLAILGAARALRYRGSHVVSTGVEHHAVFHACRQLEREGFRVTYVPVDEVGTIDVDALLAALGTDTVLVSIMLANNEIGTLAPISEIASQARSRGIVMHTDAVAAAGMVRLNVDHLGVDLLSLSAHKIYGPKGVGALYIRRGTPLEPIVYGGDQQRGKRSGTENVPGIVGFAVALLLSERERAEEMPRLVALRNSLITGVLRYVPGAHLTGHPIFRLPGHASFYLDNVTGESVLVDLDVAGFACSSGSACRAGSTDPSHVLTGIGLPHHLAKNGLRFTLGRENTEEDVSALLDVLPSIVDRSRRRLSSPKRAAIAV